MRPTPRGRGAQARAQRWVAHLYDWGLSPTAGGSDALNTRLQAPPTRLERASLAAVRVLQVSGCRRRRRRRRRFCGIPSVLVAPPADVTTATPRVESKRARTTAGTPG